MRNIVEPGRPQTKIWRMHIACWIPKPTETRSDYVRIIAFPLQQWFHESASILRYTDAVCLVKCHLGLVGEYCLDPAAACKSVVWMIDQFKNVNSALGIPLYCVTM